MSNNPPTDPTHGPVCGCDLSVVSSPMGWLSPCLTPGDIMCVSAHLLYGLKDLVVPRYEQELEKLGVSTPTPASSAHAAAARTGGHVRNRGSTSSLSSLDSCASLSTSGKGPRPCVIWNVDNVGIGQVDVLLMGTLKRTSYQSLPGCLWDFVVGVYDGKEHAPWTVFPHIHTSPMWGAATLAYLVPIPVTISVDDLKPFISRYLSKRAFRNGRSPFINGVSLAKLMEHHTFVMNYLSLIMGYPERRNAVADGLWNQTNIRYIFDDDEAAYMTPQTIRSSVGDAPLWAQGGSAAGIPSSSSRSGLSQDGRSATQSLSESHVGEVDEATPRGGTREIEDILVHASPGSSIKAKYSPPWEKVKSRAKKTDKSTRYREPSENQSDRASDKSHKKASPLMGGLKTTFSKLSPKFGHDRR